MKSRILILGAGFGGLELSTLLSEALGEDAGVTLIEKADAFVIGYSKLDVMFGKQEPHAVRLPYDAFRKPGVTLRRETITGIDAPSRKVTTSAGTHEADVLVLALGADYDDAATPGLVLGENEFYSVPGARRLRDVLPTFTKGHAVVGVCGAPYKCPPAPSECVLMLHDYLSARGLRSDCTITLVNPLPSPVPPSPATSQALTAAFAERGIAYLPERRVAAVESARGRVTLDDGRELPCDLFLGVPKHRAPDVVIESGLTENGWVPVDPPTLATKHPGVYAIGDLANPAGAPKAGAFAEDAARTVAANLLARIRGQEPKATFRGAGTCFIEFGADRVGRVDVDFFSGPKPVGILHEPSVALRAGKQKFGSDRRARWFGR
ncbi:MAG: NAD(P)/FAD-dependent oxidoreductase [Hyphomicrobiales bacterium]